MDHFVYGCQSICPVYAFDMALKRLKREIFSFYFYLDLPRMGLLSFDRARSPGKFGALILTGELTRFVLIFKNIL